MSLTVLTTGDAFCDTLDEAAEEVGRRKRDTTEAESVVTTFEESPYGGYRVYSIPAELVVDQLLDQQSGPFRPQQRRRYR